MKEHFYSETDNQWVDHIVWESMADALASEKMVENPEAAGLFDKMDTTFKSTSFSRYQLVSNQ